MKLAALDLGSNSFHLLVVDTDGPTRLTKLGSQKEVLRLGAVVQEQGQLSAGAFDAAFDSVARLAATARRLGAEQLFAVATSALRDARNGPAFIAVCRERLNVDIELLSGEDEARLAYSGARSSLASAAGRAVVVDIGGGSVEMAAGEGSHCDFVESLPLGFLRMLSAFPATEPGGVRRLAQYVRIECQKARWRIGSCGTLVLSGGTARAIGKLLRGSSAPLDATQVLSVCYALAELSPQELRQLGVQPTRATTLAAGAAVLSGVLAGLGQPELRIASGGLREGVLLRELARHAPTRAA